MLTETNRKAYGMMRRACLVAACGILIAVASVCAAVAAYPDRPIQIIISIAPGSSGDLLLREITPKLGALLGQSVIVDNRGGGGGIVGTTVVARAAPDGYTLLFGYSQTMAVNPSLYKKLAYDPLKDFTPVARVASQPLVLVTSKTVPVRTIKELAEYGQAHAGTLNYASSGSGTSAHLAGAYLSQLTGMDAVHVPYANVPQAFADLARGDISFMLYPYISLLPVIQAGNVNVLALTGPQRSAFLTDVPTMVEIGYPGFVMGPWYALYAPAGTPRDIVEKLNAAVGEVLKDPALLKEFAATGTDAWFSSPDEMAAFNRTEVDRYRKLVELSGAKAE